VTGTTLARRKRTLLLLTAALLLAALAAVAFATRKTLHLQWARWRFGSADPGDRPARAHDLEALGPDGVATLEAIAFDADATDPEAMKLRQVALDVLLQREPAGPPHYGWNDRLETPAERLALYVSRCAGLRRDAVIEALAARPERTGALLAAALGVVCDADEIASVTACRYARESKSPLAFPALRKALLLAPSVAARLEACQGLHGAPSSPETGPVLRQALADSSEVIRIHAAAELADAYHDATGLGILVAALRDRGFTDHQRRALEGLAALRRKQTIRVLGQAGDEASPTGDLREALERALFVMTNHSEPPASHWQVWIDAHARELPPQLDPETVPVEPIRAP
jgi:hypothetical protein